MFSFFNYIRGSSSTEDEPLPRVDSVVPEDEKGTDLVMVRREYIKELEDLKELFSVEGTFSPNQNLATLSKNDLIRLVVDERFKNATLQKKQHEDLQKLEDTIRKKDKEINDAVQMIYHLEDTVDANNLRINELENTIIEKDELINEIGKEIK